MNELITYFPNKPPKRPNPSGFAEPMRLVLRLSHFDCLHFQIFSRYASLRRLGAIEKCHKFFPAVIRSNNRVVVMVRPAKFQQVMK